VANFDRANCLQRLRIALARPATDAELPTSGSGTMADELLADAQIEIAERARDVRAGVELLDEPVHDGR
jgi:hypothetical protein